MDKSGTFLNGGVRVCMRRDVSEIPGLKGCECGVGLVLLFQVRKCDSNDGKMLSVVIRRPIALFCVKLCFSVIVFQ